MGNNHWKNNTLPLQTTNEGNLFVTVKELTDIPAETLPDGSNVRSYRVCVTIGVPNGQRVFDEEFRAAGIEDARRKALKSIRDHWNSMLTFWRARCSAIQTACDADALHAAYDAIPESKT